MSDLEAAMLRRLREDMRDGLVAPAEHDELAFFGTRYDAPAYDGPSIETPLGKVCCFCLASFTEGDDGWQFVNGYFSHRRCLLRNVLGPAAELVEPISSCCGAAPLIVEGSETRFYVCPHCRKPCEARMLEVEEPD